MEKPSESGEKEKLQQPDQHQRDNMDTKTDGRYKKKSQLYSLTKEADTQVVDGFWGCCRSASVEIPACLEAGLLVNGELLQEEVMEYKMQLLEAVNPNEVAAAEIYECCIYDLDHRAAVVLEAMPGLTWLPAFCKLTDQEFNSPLVCALSKGSIKVARLFIKVGRDVIMMIISSGPYQGSSALHLAVINGCKYFLSDMLEELETADRVQFINQQSPSHHFPGHSMLLALACGYDEVFFTLLKYGGDLDCVNEQNGNSVTHVLVKYGQSQPKKAIRILHEVLTGAASLDWYSVRMGLDRTKMTIKHNIDMKRMLLKMENNEGYTPIIFAAMLKVHDALNYLIKCEGVYKHTMWKIGPKSYAKYDMCEIDPTVAIILGSKRPNVLDQLLYEGDEDYLPTLDLEPVRAVMKFKWNTLKIFYYLWAILHIVMMGTMSHMSLLRSEFRAKARELTNMSQELVESVLKDPGSANITDPSFLRMWQDYEISAGVVTAVIIIYLLLELYDLALVLEMYIKTRWFWRRTRHYKATTGVIMKSDEFDMIVMMFALSTVVWFMLDRTGPWHLADIALSISLVTGWYFTLFFTRAYPPTSYFTLMVNRIIFSDLLRFAIIMLVINIGFSSAIRTLLFSPPPGSFINMVESMDTMFYLMVGMGNTNFIHQTTHTTIIRFFTIFYVVLATVSLLNMLIAAMSDTYEGISQNRDVVSRKLRVKSVMIIERRTPNFIMRWFLARRMQYSHKLGTYLLPVHETESHAT